MPAQGTGEPVALLPDLLPGAAVQRSSRSAVETFLDESYWLTMRMSHKSERGKGDRMQDQKRRAPRHWLNPFVGLPATHCLDFGKGVESAIG